MSFESLTDRYRRRQCGFANTDKYFSNASRHSRNLYSHIRRHDCEGTNYKFAPSYLGAKLFTEEEEGR